MYRYLGDPEPIDVYIYPVPEPEIGSAPSHEEILLGETGAYVAGLPIGVQRGWFSEYRVAVDEPVNIQVSAEHISGRLVPVAMRRGQGIEVSLFYVFILHGQLIKVRSTIPEDRWSNGRVGAFTEELLGHLLAQR